MRTTKEIAINVGNDRVINHKDIYLFYKEYDERIDELLMTEHIWSH